MAIFQDTLFKSLFTLRQGDKLRKFDVERKGRKRSGYSILIYSGSGGGKTTVSYQLVKEYLESKKDEFGVYITFEQSAEDQLEALEAAGVLKEGQKGKTLIVDEPYIMEDLSIRYQRVKEAAEELERKLKGLGAELENSRVEHEMFGPLKALKAERDRLLEVAKKKGFKLTPDKFTMLAKAILKKKFQLNEIEIQRVLEIGIGGRAPNRNDGVWYAVSSNKHLKKKYASLQDAIEEATKTLKMDVMDYIEMEIDTAIEDANFGELESFGIKKGSKLGIVVLDSLQIIESKLGIGKDDDQIRELWGGFLRSMKEKYGIFIVGVLERRSTQEEANILPEAYAFDCIFEISVTGQGRKKMFRDIRVVKARNVGHVQEQQPISFSDHGMVIGSIED